VIGEDLLFRTNRRAAVLSGVPDIQEGVTMDHVPGGVVWLQTVAQKQFRTASETSCQRLQVLQMKV
jgi:hypothetical protein